MLDETIQTIPSDSGSYGLWLCLSQPKNITIGKLGDITFPAGDYVYLGSAHGPGGLRARLGRHLRGDGKCHWHIDYLRAVALVRGFGYLVHFKVAINRIPIECDWSQKLAAIPKASIPVPGFGASDCRFRCVSHLISCPSLDVAKIASQLTCEIRILSFE